MKHIIIGLIRLYRRMISPTKPPTCRFCPTCSEYAIQAYEGWGFFAGTALSAYRVLRCNPYGRGGTDPVPVKTDGVKYAE